ncbi:hypothetical protein BYT27DRAFT_7105658, partial [Phlegmacium glaucopus]
DGFCIVDGTLVPLAKKPGHHGEGYFDCKSNYSLNVQVSPSSISESQLMLINWAAYYPPKPTHYQLWLWVTVAVHMMLQSFSLHIHM